MLGKSLYLGETIELSAINAEKDAATFSKWAENPVFNRRINFGLFRPIPEHEMKKKLEEQLKKAEEKRNAYLFAVRKREGGDLVGFARISWMLPSHQVGAVYVDFGAADDMLAFGDETLQLMLRYAFMEVNLHRVGVVIPAHETEMIALYERKGFLREVQRREAVYHAGKYWDELEYSLLKPEYKAKFEEESK
jgi:RimJ/RimL family protein N-acetyltransferase